MPTHDVSLSVITKLVANKDVKIKVKSDEASLGTLLISKGNLEWLPANNSVNKYRLSWERFAELMEESGKQVRKEGR